MRPFVLLVIVLLMPVHGHAVTYYISPTGSNSNNGLTQATPWLTFAHAINSARAWCGDTLVLLNGTYGDGTSTGKISVDGAACTQGDELIIQALNQRKAKIFDNGSGRAVYVTNSSYIIIDGLYARSTDNSGAVSPGSGTPFYTNKNSDIILRNLVSVNPNRYANSHVIAVENSKRVLVHDVEMYTYHRHGVEVWRSTNVVVRRAYGNTRGGRIPGGFNSGNPLGSGDSVVAFYPCEDCIAENVIADGTTHPMYMIGGIASGGNGMSLKNVRILGSICYNCGTGNAINIHSQNSTALANTPQNVTVRNVTVWNFSSPSAAVKSQDAINTVVDHMTIVGNGSGSTGIITSDSTIGGSPAVNSIFMNDVIVGGLTGPGLAISGVNTWSGDHIWSYSNGTNFSPALPSNWTNTSTTPQSFGACKGLWLPDGHALKGAGTGGSDPGATVLYRYVDGVLTTTPLWDPTTGEFPHGAADLDNINAVAGQSLFDFHLRMNVNTGGCPFPAGYGGGGGGVPTDPPGHNISSGTGAISDSVVIPSGLGHLLAFVALRDGGVNVGTITGVTSSCGGGEAFTFGARGRSHASGGSLHNVEGWHLSTPTSGTCTISVSTNGTATSWIMDVVEADVGTGTPVWAGNGSNGTLSSSSTVTVPTNTSESIFAATSGSDSATISAGANQTLLEDAKLPPMRLAVSSQSGNDGGVMDYVFGGNTFWGIVAVSIPPTSPDPPSASTFRVSNYRIYSLHGTSATPEVSLGALASQNAAAQIGATGHFRLRAEIIVENADSTETGIHPYCKKLGGSFVSVGNGFGSGYIRYYGAGAEPTIPASLTATTQRFSGTFVPGFTSRDSSLPVTLPTITAGSVTEIDYQFSAGNGLAAGDTVECQIWYDDGSGPIGTHTNAMRINIVGPTASMGF